MKKTTKQVLASLANKQPQLFLPLDAERKLQFFANGDNNNQGARSYQPQFKELLQAVFLKQAYFADFFVGGLEALDGVQHNATAFTIKTSDIPVVVGSSYDKGEDVAFGAGTGSTTRFGERTEIVYVDTPVNYSWEWKIHEGIDRATVNNDFNVAVADRLELQAQAKVQKFDNQHALFINSSAGKTSNLTSYSNDDVLALFTELAKYYTNIGAIGVKVAKVNTELYNKLVEHPLTTSAKNSSANIDDNGILKFKGFIIDEVPDAKFPSGVAALTYIRGMGKAFTGINTARTIEAHDFDGIALQGHGKAGEFTLKDNKPAIVKITAPIVTPPQG